MKELDLMHALEGVDEDILLEAERLEHRPRRRLLHRATAVAAIIALLCGTVYAAVMRVVVEVTDRTWVYHHEVLREDVLYTDIEVHYELTEQEITEEAADFVTGYLDEHWWASLRKDPIGMVSTGQSFVAGSHYWEENGVWKRPDGLDTHYFRTLAEAADFFGMEFTLPDWILEAEPHTYAVTDAPGARLRVLTPPLVEEGAEVHEYLESAPIEELEQRIVPGYVELTFKIDGITPELSGVSGEILFAINEDAAFGGYTYQLSMPLEYLGEPSYRALDIDGLDGTLVVFPPCETDIGSVSAYYTSNGVAYILHAYPAEDAVVEDPAQLLLPWLEQLG